MSCMILVRSHQGLSRFKWMWTWTRRNDPFIAGKAHTLTLLTHAGEMVVKAPLILHEGRISLLMVFFPIADVLSQPQVMGRRPVELVGQRAEEAVAVSNGVRGIKSEVAQLCVEHLAILFGTSHDGLEGVISVCTCA